MQRTAKIAITPDFDNHQTELAWQYAYNYLQAYPGGVCWVNVQDGEVKVAGQIIEFAKSKLGLLPEDGNLQSQIDYCWSHWQQGDVLVVFDNVKNNQQIEAYLPPKEQRFKVILTTSVESLSLENSFDVLHSKVKLIDKLGSVLEDSNEPLSNNFLYILLIYLLILLVISICSLIASYYLFSSEAWKKAYGKQGWIIEFARSLFLLIGTGALLGVIFSKDACEVLGFNRAPPVTIKLVSWTRFFIIVSFFIGLAIITKDHFYTAPIELSNNSKNSNLHLDYIHGYLIPYLCYLPYSLVTLLFMCLPVFLIGIYAAIKDSISLRINRNQLRDLLKLISHNPIYSSFEKENCKEIEAQFDYFSSYFIEKIGRYTYLILGSGFTTAFEYWFGKSTLSNTAQTWTTVGYFLLFSIFALICTVGFFFYDNAFNESYNILNKLGCYNSELFEKKHNGIQLLNRLLRRYLFLPIGLILLIITLFHMLFISSG